MDARGTTPPPGWYPDPVTGQQWAWWDGQGWVAPQPVSPGADTPRLLRRLLLAGAVVLGLGAVFAGLLGSVVAADLASRPDRALGTVVELNPSVTWSTDSGRTEGCAPQARFRAADGREYLTDSSVEASPCLWELGDEVTVAYDADDPTNATIDEGDLAALPWIAGAAAGLAALLALGMAIAAFVLGRRYRRAAARA